MTTKHNQKQSKEKGPVPDARHEQSLRRVNAAIEAGLVEFDHHRESLLTILRDAYDRGVKSEPFDEDKSWSHLTGVARVHYWQARVKQETMPVADREVRLRELAKALGKARGMADKAMQDDVGDDLLSAWWEATNEPRASVVRNDDGSFTLVRIADETFKDAVAGLAALETAALRAASEAHEKHAGRSGPRRGTWLLDCIGTLAALYRDSTGAKPGAGHGPFVRFVCAFLAAIRANISEEYVVELVQNARSWARINRGNWTSSPFDD